VESSQQAIQQELFDDPYQRKRELEKTVLALRAQGKQLQKAALMHPKETEES